MSAEITKSQFDAYLSSDDSLVRKEVSQPGRIVTVYVSEKTDSEYDLYTVNNMYFVGEKWLHQYQESLA